MPPLDTAIYICTITHTHTHTALKLNVPVIKQSSDKFCLLNQIIKIKKNKQHIKLNIFYESVQ